MTQPPAAMILFLAILIQVALTLHVLVRVGRTRLGHVRSRRVKISDIALGQDAWPEDATKLANSYRSQFELPVLFYVAALLAIAFGIVDMVLALLAVAFVAGRIAHMYVHTGSNDVGKRFNIFLVGVALVALIWAWLFIKIVLGV